MAVIGLHVLLSILFLLSISCLCKGENARKVCVVPTENSTCNCSVPCHTFDYYASHPQSELYIYNHLTLEFLPGTHKVENSFVSSNRTDLHLIGINASIEIYYDGNTSWFSLHNSSNISLSDLSFIWTQTSHQGPHVYVFYFSDVSNIMFSHFDLTNIWGGGMNLSTSNNVKFTLFSLYTWFHGFNMLNMEAKIDISHCFLNGSNQYSLVVAEYSELQHNFSLSIEHCEFFNGSGSFELSGHGTPQHVGRANQNTKMSIKFDHINFTTPKGGDINVGFTYFGDDVVVEVSLTNLKLFHAMSFGMFLEFATFFGMYNVQIGNCNILHHSEGGIRLYNGGSQGSEISITDTLLSENQASQFHFPISALLIKGTTDPTSNPLTVLKNVTFDKNTFIDSASVNTVVTVMLFFVNHIRVSDCHFKNNVGTALFLENSKINVTGMLTFTNNTAHNGAALYLHGPSIVVTNMNSTIFFRNNHATDNGGAIYIEFSSLNEVILTLDEGPLDEPCFVLVEEYNFKSCIDNNCTLNFEGNVADDGGRDIFGGNLGLIVYPSSDKRCVTVVEEISNMSSSVSSISSSPSRVCICNNSFSADNCLNYIKDVHIYPGQTFTISAVTVGQHFGTSRGYAYAQILNKSSTASIKKEQIVQTVDIWNCDDKSNILKYTIEISHFIESETIVLTTEDISVSEFINRSLVNDAIQTYKRKSYIPPLLLKLPVYITVHFTYCPNGFEFIGHGCDCKSVFSGHKGTKAVSCDIETQEIRRQSSVWVDAQKNSISYSQYCPLLYCNSSVVYVNLSKEDGRDAQCVNQRSRVLCGGCQNGYSLAIGSSNCLPHCSNNYLWLLLPFGAAGVLLVLVIKYLNLTITQGMISGIIFYANIIQTNKNVFLTSNEVGINVLATFIAWLNLDFGIQTCFFRDMDMYTKTWLQFVFPIYLWTLAGGIILACRYSATATMFFGSNAVQVLATIFLLSYNKLLILITTVFSSSTIYVQNDIGEIKPRAVWTYDGNIEFFGTKHVILFATSTFILLFLWLPFTLCVLLGQWLQRCNHYKGLRWIGRMKPLLDAYYGPLKHNRHYWVGVLLIARIVVIAPAADPHAPISSSALTIIILCSLLLLLTVWLGRFYRRLYLTLLETSYIINLGVCAALLLYFESINSSPTIAMYSMVGIALIVFLCVVVFQALRQLYSRVSCSRQNTYASLQDSVEN